MRYSKSKVIGNPSSSLAVLSSPKSNAARVSTDLQMSWESAWSIIHFVRSKLSSPSSSQLFHFSFFSAAGNHTLHKARGKRRTYEHTNEVPEPAIGCSSMCRDWSSPQNCLHYVSKETHLHANNGKEENALEERQWIDWKLVSLHPNNENLIK